jgi:hypothetical protein
MCFSVLHTRCFTHEKPWKQTIARLQTPEGAIIGISHASLYFSETMKGYFRMLETRPADRSANPSFTSLRDYFTNSQ